MRIASDEMMAKELLSVAKSLTGFTPTDIRRTEGKHQNGEFVQFELPNGVRYIAQSNRWGEWNIYKVIRGAVRTLHTGFTKAAAVKITERYAMDEIKNA